MFNQYRIYFLTHTESVIYYNNNEKNSMQIGNGTCGFLKWICLDVTYKQSVQCYLDFHFIPHLIISICTPNQNYNIAAFLVMCNFISRNGKQISYSLVASVCAWPVLVYIWVTDRRLFKGVYWAKGVKQVAQQGRSGGVLLLAQDNCMTLPQQEKHRC